MPIWRYDEAITINYCFTMTFYKKRPCAHLPTDVLYNKKDMLRRRTMKCPICNCTNSIEIDMHSDGYAKDLIECANCGALWLSQGEEIVLLNNKVA